MLKSKFMMILFITLTLGCGRPEFGKSSSNDGLLSGSPTDELLDDQLNNATIYNNATLSNGLPSQTPKDDAFYSDLSRDGNFVYSPQSVSMILSALFLLSSGSTKDELAEFYTPQYSLSGNEFASLWIDDTLSIDPVLIDQLIEIGVEVRQLSLSSSDLRTRINNLVRDETRGFLGELIPPLETLKGDFLIASASFYNTPFQSGFDSNQTYNDSFFGQRTSDRQFMVQSGLYPAVIGEEIQAIAIPMEKGKTLLLMMPTGGLASIESQLSYAFMERLHDEMTSEELEIHIPKLDFVSTFRVDGTSIIDFDNADYSVLSSGAKAGAIIHQIRFILNETGLMTDVLPGGGPELRIRELHFNRPFVFSILDFSTQTIDFMGRIQN